MANYVCMYVVLSILFIFLLVVFFVVFLFTCLPFFMLAFVVAFLFTILMLNDVKAKHKYLDSSFLQEYNFFLTPVYKVIANYNKQAYLRHCSLPNQISRDSMHPQC